MQYLIQQNFKLNGYFFEFTKVLKFLLIIKCKIKKARLLFPLKPVIEFNHSFLKKPIFNMVLNSILFRTIFGISLD